MKDTKAIFSSSVQGREILTSFRFDVVGPNNWFPATK